MADTGDFNIGDQGYRFAIQYIQTYDGTEYSGSDIEDHIAEADRVFYEVYRYSDGEDFHRWLGGPFMNIDDVEAAIIDETDVYS